MKKFIVVFSLAFVTLPTLASDLIHCKKDIGSVEDYSLILNLDKNELEFQSGEEKFSFKGLGQLHILRNELGVAGVFGVNKQGQKIMMTYFPVLSEDGIVLPNKTGAKLITNEDSGSAISYFLSECN